MTPAIRLLEQAKIPFTLHEYAHDEKAEAFGLEAAEKLGVPAACVFKTLVAKVETARGPVFAFGIIPSDARLNLKAIADAVKGKRAEMADPKEAERLTGYVVGGISPMGGKKRMPAVLDASANSQEKIFVSAGRRGLQVQLAPADLARLIGATVAAITA